MNFLSWKSISDSLVKLNQIWIEFGFGPSRVGSNCQKKCTIYIQKKYVSRFARFARS